MSTDGRKVSTDALETLGTIIGEGETRDAIHLAVEPVMAGGPLEPGDHVGFVSPGVVGTDAAAKVGIVDPFLAGTVPEGQRFWLVVYPRQVTSLRHVWTHPAFPEEAGAAAPVAPASAEPGADPTAPLLARIEELTASLARVSARLEEAEEEAESLRCGC